MLRRKIERSPRRMELGANLNIDDVAFTAAAVQLRNQQ